MRIKTGKSIIGNNTITYTNQNNVFIPINSFKRPIKLQFSIAPNFIIYNR